MNSQKILIVDDKPEIRHLAVALLEETDLEVVEAESADRALECLRNDAEHFAVVFTDVVMPGRIDGMTLARTVKARWPWMGVIVTSGYMRWPNSDLPRSATFLAKPWRGLDLLVAVERAAAGSEAARRSGPA